MLVTMQELTISIRWFWWKISMAKRIKSTTLEKFAKGLGIAGIPLSVLIFTYLITLGTVTVDSYKANEVCGGNELCWLELINVTFKEDVFIYPMEGEKLINARPSDSIEWVKLYRSWGSGWREIPLDNTCTGSWCGCYWCTKYSKAKYSYVFRKGRTYNIRYEIKKDPESTINWKINPEGEWKYIYKYVYSNKTIKTPIYDYKEVIIKPVYSEINKTWSKEIKYNERTLIGYDTKSVPDKKIGVQTQNKIINNPNVYIDEDNYLYEWSVSIGDRNFIEYGFCSVSDIKSGVCTKTKLI